MKETTGFFQEGAAIVKGHLEVRSPGVCSRKPSPSSSAFSEAALTSLEVNMLPGTHVLQNRGPWRPSQESLGNLCTQLQGCPPEGCLDNGFEDTKLAAAGSGGQQQGTKSFPGRTGLALAAQAWSWPLH